MRRPRVAVGHDLIDPMAKPIGRLSSANGLTVFVHSEAFHVVNIFGNDVSQVLLS